CALLVREPERALLWARSARERFETRGNLPWLARAELAEYQALLAGHLDAAERRVAELVDVAERATALAEREKGPGSRRLARDAHLTAAEAFAAAGRAEQASEALALAGRGSERSPLPLALRSRLVKAQL